MIPPPYSSTRTHPSFLPSPLVNKKIKRFLLPMQQRTDGAAGYLILRTTDLYITDPSGFDEASFPSVVGRRHTASRRTKSVFMACSIAAVVILAAA